MRTISYILQIHTKSCGMWTQNTEQRPKQIKTQHNTETKNDAQHVHGPKRKQNNKKECELNCKQFLFLMRHTPCYSY